MVEKRGGERVVCRAKRERGRGGWMRGVGEAGPGLTLGI